MLGLLKAWDLAIVHWFGCNNWNHGRRIAVFVSRLGNGWLYLAILPLILIGLGLRGVPVIIVAALNAAITHAVYPFIKRRIARPRPCDSDPALVSLLKAKDLYSFPSGHTMTLTAVLWPIAQAAPGSSGVIIGTIAVMSWARIASAHHYPTDVCSGVILGGLVAYPLSILYL